MDEHTVYLLELSKVAETEKPHLRDTVLYLLGLGIKQAKVMAATSWLVVATGMFACLFPMLCPEMLLDSVWVTAWWSLIFGGIALMGVVFFVVQVRTLCMLKDRLFLKQLTWVESEDGKTDRE